MTDDLSPALGGQPDADRSPQLGGSRRKRLETTVTVRIDPQALARLEAISAEAALHAQEAIRLLGVSMAEVGGTAAELRRLLGPDSYTVEDYERAAQICALQQIPFDQALHLYHTLRHDVTMRVLRTPDRFGSVWEGSWYRAYSMMMRGEWNQEAWISWVEEYLAARHLARMMGYRID